jgi:L-ascorbate metabolism protein UlaG (beta-lactamase superfamily)
LCLCAVGRAYRKDYTRRIVELTRPRVVIPCHWDDFTLPYDVPPRQLPGVDVAGFVEEIRSAGASPVVLGFGQSWRF